MNSALKAVAFRWPQAPMGAARSLGLAQCSPKAASFSTSCLVPGATSLVRLSIRAPQQQQSLILAPRCFARAKHDLASAAQKAPNATDNKTAADLGSKKQVKPTPSSANVGASTAAAGAPLDWNTFFKLRLRRRRIQLFFSLTSSLAAGFGGAVMLSTGAAEPIVSMFPLDPIFTLGFMVIACAGMGWLIGPSIGSQVFYLSNSQIKQQMRRKESDFLAHIKRNRADPSNSSAGNPVPDFYGEKIQSVSGYRRWLKDQRAFNRKKTQAFV